MSEIKSFRLVCDCYRSVTEKKEFCEDDGKCAAVRNIKWAKATDNKQGDDGE